MKTSTPLDPHAHDTVTALRRLRVSRRATLATVVSGPAATLIALMTRNVFTALVLIMLWLPILVTAVLFQVSLVCPHCGKPFYRNVSYRGVLPGGSMDVLARHCLNCGASPRNT